MSLLSANAVSTGDASYWEKAILCVNEPAFDCFNKVIWEKIDTLANSLKRRRFFMG